MGTWRCGISLRVFNSISHKMSAAYEFRRYTYRIERFKLLLLLLLVSKNKNSFHAIYPWCQIE